MGKRNQSIKHLLATASERLDPHVDTHSVKLEAEILLAFVLKKDRTFLFTWPEKEVGAQDREAFFKLVHKREKGTPIAHIVGTREFWSLPISVNSQCLIPRPETELLVELVLDRISPDSGNILDLGTGSGAIALALAKERPHWTITAVDQSQACIDLASLNCAQLGIGNIEVIKSNWYDAVKPQTFSAIVSNPPYIAKNDPHLNRGDVRFEPASSLISENRGLSDLFAVIDGARDYLKSESQIFLEHGYNQTTKVQQYLEDKGFSDIQTHQDYNHIDRACSACWR